ncbi:MAG: sel1 repeat family protein [Alphaproteobacteria bacterium]|nr:sel1 repeat family protein [Alphaproteobacteria bacterium]
MTTRKCLAILFAALTLLLSTLGDGISWADAFNDGFNAYLKSDYTTAMKILRPLAQAGNKAAALPVGTMYEKGQGVPQDFAEALKWYLLGASEGDDESKTNAGRMYLFGKGTKKDFAAAMKWFQEAAPKDSGAQFYLGLMYENGNGVTQDYKEAAKWYRKAARRGWDRAFLNLALLYEEGRGVSQDNTRAYMWLSLAVYKSDDVDQHKATLKAKMTKRQIIQAAKWAKRCEDTMLQELGCDDGLPN